VVKPKKMYSNISKLYVKFIIFKFTILYSIYRKQLFYEDLKPFNLILYILYQITYHQISYL